MASLALQPVVVVRIHRGVGYGVGRGKGKAKGCEPWVAKVVSVQGPVELQPGGGAGWPAAGFDATLCAGDRILVGSLGRR
jgi:hypothetical protein